MFKIYSSNCHYFVRQKPLLKLIASIIKLQLKTVNIKNLFGTFTVICYPQIFIFWAWIEINVIQASQCGAVKHCIKTVWEKETVPLDDDEVV